MYYIDNLTHEEVIDKLSELFNDLKKDKESVINFLTEFRKLTHLNINRNHKYPVSLTYECICILYDIYITFLKYPLNLLNFHQVNKTVEMTISSLHPDIFYFIEDEVTKNDELLYKLNVIMDSYTERFKYISQNYNVTKRNYDLAKLTLEFEKALKEELNIPKNKTVVETMEIMKKDSFQVHNIAFFYLNCLKTEFLKITKFDIDEILSRKLDALDKVEEKSNIYWY